MERLNLKQDTVKKLFTLSILFITYFSSFGQFQAKGFHHDKPINMAAILATQQPSVAIGFSSISEARNIISDIMNVVGQPQNFKVMSTTQVDNAAAVVYQGQRYILYNPSFINKLDNVANDKWASISVVAHEIGHHLLGHTLDGRGSQHPKELGADEFSGAALHKLGATLQQAQLAMQLISSPNASATHPGQRERLSAIAKGWGSTSEQTTNNRDVAIEYPEDRSNYPSTDKNGYPTDRRSYPQSGRNQYPQNERSNYPDPRYPDYPSAGNGRRTYPSDNRNYPGSETRERVRQGNNTGPYGRRGNTVNNETITYQVKFKQGNGERYFITSRNNVVKYSGNRLYVVAKITNSNSSNYPYIIYDDQVQLYVDRRGNIYSDNGRSVGYITHHS